MPDDNFVSSVIQFFTQARCFCGGKSARLKSRDRRRRKPRQADFGSPLAEKMSPRGTKIAKRTGFQPENAAVGRHSPDERWKVLTTSRQSQAVFSPPHGKKRRTEAARPPSESLRIPDFGPFARVSPQLSRRKRRPPQHKPRPAHPHTADRQQSVRRNPFRRPFIHRDPAHSAAVAAYFTVSSSHRTRVLHMKTSFQSKQRRILYHKFRQLKKMRRFSSPSKWVKTMCRAVGGISEPARSGHSTTRIAPRAR